MVNKIDIKPATLISGSTVSVQILKYVDGSLSEDNTYTFDANDFEALMSASNPYVAILTFGTVHTENINGSTTQCFFDGVVCSPNDAYTLATLVDADVTAYASGGGGYTFPSNSGNTAYVSSGGNNATGVVGNISKPFLTANAAIAALNNAVDGALIILSSTAQIDITDYDHTSMPYNLSVQVLCDQSLRINSEAAFGKIGIQTNGDVRIDTQTGFSVDDTLKINCKTFTIPDTSEGSITYSGVITCDDLEIEANMNINIAADVLNWSKSATVGAVNTFTYNICPPKQWKAVISQTDMDAPVVDVVVRNTYGETMTTTRIGGGFYTINSASSLFIVNKTQIYFGTSDLDVVGAPSVMNKGGGSDGEVAIYSLDQYLSVGDDLIKSLDITIETYL